jgi:hypothetical protein
VLTAGLLVLFQLIYLPQHVLGLLSPRAAQIRSLGNGYGLGPFLPLSLNSNATVKESVAERPVLRAKELGEF